MTLSGSRSSSTGSDSDSESHGPQASSGCCQRSRSPGTSISVSQVTRLRPCPSTICHRPCRLGHGTLPARRPPSPHPAATRSGRAAALFGQRWAFFVAFRFRRSRRRAYVLYSPNSPLLVHRDLCAPRSTTLRGLEMTAKFVARARTALRRHRAHHHA